MSTRPIRFVDLAPLAAVLCIAACGKDEAKKGKTPPPSDASAAHVHPPAPHGGEVLDLGLDEFHLELIHDHTGGNVTVYVFEADLKTPIRVAAPKITIATKDGPQEFTLTAIAPAADGTSDAWKGSHPGLVADPWNGRISVTIRGKTYQSPLEGEPHAHD